MARCLRPGVPFRGQLIPLDGPHHVDDALVDMRELAVGQRSLVGRADVLIDHLFAVRLVDRQRRLRLQVAYHQRGLCPFAEQFHKLAVQHVDALTQFFDCHSILEIAYGS
jgi:hypothetical protein